MTSALFSVVQERIDYNIALSTLNQSYVSTTTKGPSVVQLSACSSPCSGEGSNWGNPDCYGSFGYTASTNVTFCTAQPFLFQASQANFNCYPVG